MGCVEHIVLENVVKAYGRLKALDKINLRVCRGERVAILGPNGAGKTTLVKIISGQMRATSGTVRVMGKNPAEFSRELRRNIGFVSHNPMLYDELTAYENLKFYANLYSVGDKNRVNELLKKLKLYDRRHSRVKTFSRGMKQRLAIARALLHDPEILILDEPTSGLDIEGRLELLKNLSSIDKTILLTTHNLSEAERLCSRAVILTNGKVVAECSMDEAERIYLEKCI
ncbi:MAG: ABC transporter [Archaeoglobus sp.]|jgi:heme ABC exporter ATP-binding subunit CcmA|nr:MAG: ABC transporter [Archaeoglobus sp.]